MHYYVAVFTAYSLAKKIKILKWYEGEAGSTLPVLERKDKGRKLCLPTREVQGNSCGL